LYKSHLRHKSNFSCHLKNEAQPYLLQSIELITICYFMLKLHTTKLIKIMKKLIIQFFVISLIIPIILVRLIRRWKHIRFGLINASRLGHFACDTALYLAEVKNGLHKGYIDLFYYTTPCQNNYLKNKLNYYFHYSRIVEHLIKANKIIPGYKKHSVVFPCGEDTYDLLKDSPLPLKFTPDEEKLGQDTLNKFGIQKNDNFVCFTNRESAYLDKMYPRDNWDYHNYRDSDIKNYIPAMEEMARRGYFVLRMGSVVKEPLDIINPRIIDYACS